MRSQVIVLSQQEYSRWLQQGDQAAGGIEPAGQELFAEAGCSGCHAFEPAGSTAQVGPSLDDLPDDPGFVRESIVEPDADVTEGYQPGVMPKTYGEQLSDEQLDVLVQYLLGGSE